MNNRILQVSTSTAKELMNTQQIHAHNLANSNTVGFKEHLEYFDGKDQKTAASLQSGSLMSTNRELDVAIAGEGFFAVQNKEGKEGYSRAGHLVVDSQGFLKTGTGLLVMGSGGAIHIPEAQKIEIAVDGQISVLLPDAQNGQMTPIERIKAVKADSSMLHIGEDGLLYADKGLSLDADLSVVMQPGFLEESNVNVVWAMTNMIEAARDFEMQLKMLHANKENDEADSRIVTGAI